VTFHPRLVLVSLLTAGVSAGCQADDAVWVDFNAPDQTLVVQVTAEEVPLGEPVLIDLVSNVGGLPVGTAELDPGSGPVGTDHFLFVEVFDDFEELVGRASVEVASEAVSDLDGDGDQDSRGEGEFDLVRDSADPGVFALTLLSLGAPGEVREDEFTVHLWTQDLGTAR
jgi:hypothetical protein